MDIHVCVFIETLGLQIEALVVFFPGIHQIMERGTFYPAKIVLALGQEKYMDILHEKRSTRNSLVLLALVKCSPKIITSASH